MMLRLWRTEYETKLHVYYKFISHRQLYVALTLNTYSLVHVMPLLLTKYWSTATWKWIYTAKQLLFPDTILLQQTFLYNKIWLLIFYVMNVNKWMNDALCDTWKEIDTISSSGGHHATHTNSSTFQSHVGWIERFI